jgi:hypothetical protein
VTLTADRSSTCSSDLDHRDDSDKPLPVFKREMTARNVHGRRIRRKVTGSRNDDGSITFEVEDEEIDDAAPVVAPPAAPKPVTRSPFEVAMGDPDFDFRWC